MSILWDFVTEETRRIERFEDWWAHQHTLKPEEYPMWLKDEDWDEQYRTWCSI